MPYSCPWRRTSGPRGVAIFREMRLGSTDGVQITNLLSGYEVWLTGSVDYAIIQYKDKDKRVVYLSE